MSSHFFCLCSPSGPSGDDTFVGTNQVFFGSNGGGYGWARAPRVPVSRQALKDLQSLKNREVQRDGYTNSGKIQSVPHLGGTNFAFNGADGYHYGWAKQQQQVKPDSSTSSKKAKVAKKSTLQVLLSSSLCFCIDALIVSRVFSELVPLRRCARG